MKIPQVRLLVGVVIFSLGCASHKPETDSPNMPATQVEAFDGGDEAPNPVALAAPIESSGSALLESCDACFSGAFTRPGAEEQACLELVDDGTHDDDTEASDTDVEAHKHTARLIIFDKDGRQLAAAPLDEWWSDKDGSKEWSLDGIYPLCGAADLDALVVYMFSEEGVCPDSGTELLAVYSFADSEEPARRIWEKTGANVSPVEYGDGFLIISYLSSDAACGGGDGELKPSQFRLECREGELVERPSRP